MSVKAILNGYLTNGHSSRSIINMGDFMKNSGPAFKSVETTVRDGRLHPELNLDDNSFQLVVHPTALKTEEFYNSEEKIKSEYYAEIAQLIKKTTGAAHVHVFHHQVRCAKKANGGAKDISSVQGYAGGVHSDSSPIHGDATFKEMLKQISDPKLREQCKTGRYLYINAWRNISDEPILNNALAVCDETSLVKPDDFVTGDLIHPSYKVQQYRLDSRHADQHQWYYFSKQTKDEVLLFKQIDSDPTLTGRTCFHTSFEIPDAPADAPPRESIEVRAFAFFPDHEPNTCPIIEVPAKVEGEIEPPKVYAEKIVHAFKIVPTWPEAAKVWFKSASAETIIAAMLKDEANYMDLKDKSDELKQKVRAVLDEMDINSIIAKAKEELKESFDYLGYGRKMLRASVVPFFSVLVGIMIGRRLYFPH